MSKKVVLMEDDEAVSDILVIMLTNYGLDVSSMRVGAYFKTDDIAQHPDLFLIDRNLPGVDGLSICKQLKSEPATRDIPVVIISASHDFVRKASAAGADACLEKPFSRKDLFSTIDRFIQKD